MTDAEIRKILTEMSAADAVKELVSLGWTHEEIVILFMGYATGLRHGIDKSQEALDEMRGLQQ